MFKTSGEEVKGVSSKFIDFILVLSDNLLESKSENLIFILFII